jgi:excisionase family DNA binding protein
MNKEQAAKKIGISVRTLQRKMSEHRIAFKMKRTKTGEAADFDKAEVERFKRELKEGMTATVTHGVIKPSEPVTAFLTNADATEQTALAPVDLMHNLATMFQAMARGQIASSSPPVQVGIASKLMLSIVEASELSGVSVAKLRDAVHAGELKAIKGIGRGLGKVKRDDLIDYINNL